MNNIFLSAALVIWIYFSLVFLLAQALSNNSIVDSFWGPGFLTTALYTFALSPYRGTRSFFITGLVLIWAVRLFTHITLRNWNKPEDYRYAAMREKWGNHQVRLKAYFKVFMTQGILLYLIALPIIHGNSAADQSIGLTEVLGLILWLIGFYFEALGDYQLKVFKAKTENRIR